MEQVAEKWETWQEEQREKQREKQTEELPGERKEQKFSDSEYNRKNKRELENNAGKLPKFGESRVHNQTSDQKTKSIRYFKGLFGRIIIACFLFLLLFLGRIFSVNVVGQNTESVLDEVRNNKFVESLEQKLSEVFQKSENSESEIEK